MINLKIKDWKLDYGENLDFESLKSIYSPQHRFRVSEFHYPVDEKIDGSMRAGKCFIMSGVCVYKFSSNNGLELKSGDYVELPEGAYKLTVKGQNDAHIIYVWEIPDLINRKS